MKKTVLVNTTLVIFFIYGSA